MLEAVGGGEARPDLCLASRRRACLSVRPREAGALVRPFPVALRRRAYVGTRMLLLWEELGVRLWLRETLREKV